MVRNTPNIRPTDSPRVACEKKKTQFTANRNNKDKCHDEPSIKHQDEVMMTFTADLLTFFLDAFLFNVILHSALMYI